MNVIIALGSNTGHRLANLQKAVALLRERCIPSLRCSVVTETPCLLPEGAPPDWDRPFLNMIVRGPARLQPHPMLEVLQGIEREMGRPWPRARWSPRIIDLDILTWEGVRLDSPDLVIPHPEIPRRPFLKHLLALETMDPLYIPPDPLPFERCMVVEPALMGIVNITPDSFSDGGQFNTPEKALTRIHTLARDGASVIDLGAQSTRPGATLHGPDAEYACLKPVLEHMDATKEDHALQVSVDTFWPETIARVLEHPAVTWINDVSGMLDSNTLRAIAHSGRKLCTMHSLGVPPSTQNCLAPHSPAHLQVASWAGQTIRKLLDHGFEPEQIILDPGIGFGKSMTQNLDILCHIRHFSALCHSAGVAVLVGHSRKGYLRACSPLEASGRDTETLAHSAQLASCADFLRVHNVEAHQRFLSVHHLLQKENHDEIPPFSG